MNKEWTIPEMLQVSGSYWTACALQAAVQLDVFTLLDNIAKEGKNGTITGIAQTLGVNERAFSMLATALVALGLLERDGETLLLPDHARIGLSQNSEAYVGFIIKHHAHIMPAWTKLAEAVKIGSPMREVSSSDTESEAEREAFLMGMFNVAMAQAEKVAAALDLSNAKRLLDLGGGPGTYAVFFSLANTHLRATVFDRPTSEKFAMGVVRRFNVANRVDFVGGDFLTDELPGGYDVAWLSQILHGDTPKDAANVVKKAAATLNKGGQLAIQEFIIDDDRNGPVHPTLFSLNMLVGTPGGQAYTWSELEVLLKDAGAVSVRRLDVALPMGCGIIIGQF